MPDAYTEKKLAKQPEFPLGSRVRYTGPNTAFAGQITTVVKDETKGRANVRNPPKEVPMTDDREDLDRDVLLEALRIQQERKTQIGGPEYGDDR